jgi:hypothetical protein
VASLISECGGGGQALYPAVSVPENAKKCQESPSVAQTAFISRFDGLKIRCE